MDLFSFSQEDNILHVSRQAVSRNFVKIGNLCFKIQDTSYTSFFIVCKNTSPGFSYKIASYAEKSIFKSIIKQ